MSSAGDGNPLYRRAETFYHRVAWPHAADARYQRTHPDTFVVTPPYIMQTGREVFVAESPLASNGRTSVPAEVRAALRVVSGTRLEWRVTPNGDVIVRASDTVNSKPDSVKLRPQ